MKVKFYLLFFLMIGAFSTGFAQDFQVSGQVTSKTTGKPLPGITINVKGGKVVGITNDAGAFSVKVPRGTVLVFSSVEMDAVEVPVNNSVPLSVVLTEKNSSMDEVVVIGYGTQKKSLVTGALAHISSQDIANKEIVRLDQALQGMASGVTVTQNSGAPNAGFTIRVRGTTTINNSDPIYVVDGFVLNGGLEYLNPNDIISIEVMKDAASAAIYGSQAANGVVIVTTKKGALNNPMRVNYDMQIGVQGPVNKVKLTNATQYAELRNEAALNDGNAVPYPSPTIYGSG
ncbi:MAG: TonB-dependent receptor plug domain-containing protein, partial [Chitinophagaceae bacterium]|nr:TonB-dependent receptor plug domain-containing protein [Chitinophagaceae bacterium]